MPDETKPEGAVPPTPPAEAKSEAKPEAKPATPPAAAAPPAAAKPTAPPPPPKAPIPTPQPWDTEMVARLKAKFGEAILESMSYLGQNYFVVEAAQIEAITLYLRDSEQYNMLADLT